MQTFCFQNMINSIIILFVDVIILIKIGRNFCFSVTGSSTKILLQQNETLHTKIVIPKSAYTLKTKSLKFEI